MTHFLDRHRSVRFVEIRWFDVLSTFLTASVLTGLMLSCSSFVVGMHRAITGTLLRWIGLPATADLACFGYEADRSVSGACIAGAASVTGAAGYSGRVALFGATFVVSALLLVAIYATFRYVRMLAGFLIVVLLCTLLNQFAGNPSRIDADLLIRTWLRFEFAVWVLLPWMMAGICAWTVPVLWARLLWTAVPTAYGLVWSAVRLAFCIGVLHFTGPLLVAPLWFTVGPLADLLYITMFYSFAIYHTGRLLAAERA